MLLESLSVSTVCGRKRIYFCLILTFLNSVFSSSFDLKFNIKFEIHSHLVFLGFPEFQSNLPIKSIKLEKFPKYALLTQIPHQKHFHYEAKFSSKKMLEEGFFIS